MRRLLAALTALLLLAGLAGCTAAPAPQVTASPDLAGVPAALRVYAGQRIVWRDCDGGFRCATAVAPLDWSKPSGARIRLALTMRPASGAKLGTLFTNPGGPGVSGVDFLRGGGDRIFDSALLSRYDVVAWDPRGVGASSAVDCYGTSQLDAFLFDDPDLSGGALRTEAERSAKAFADACAARTGALLAHVGTADTVQDLDMLRAVVGSPRLDYFGFSYGTYIGAEYADRYPTRVGRMVLDGAVDPSLTDFQRTLADTRAFGQAFQRYLADCLTSTSCPFQGQTLQQATDSVAALVVALRKRPLRATDGRAVNGAVLRIAIDASLYDRGSWPALTTALRELLRGDPDRVQQLADGYVERGASGYESNLFEAIYAVNCLDRPTTTDPAELAAQGRQLDAADPLARADDADDLGNPVCANWPVPPESTPRRVTATGSPAILVLGTTGDPATPIAWARSLAGQLPKGVLLTYRGEGHTAYRNGDACINDRVDAYLLSGTVPAPTTCG